MAKTPKLDGIGKLKHEKMPEFTPYKQLIPIFYFR